MDVSLDTTAAAAKSHQSCPTLWSHRRQPTRLLHPWDSPGKSTGVGCHCHANKHKSQLRKDLAWTLNRLWDLRLPASLNKVRATEDEMAGWHHHFNGRELGQTLGDGEGQGSLVYCSPQGCETLETTWWLNNNNNSICSRIKWSGINVYTERVKQVIFKLLLLAVTTLTGGTT